MDTITQILICFKNSGSLSGSDIARILGISRQVVNYHLKKLVLEGRVTKSGRTRSAVYTLAETDGSEALCRNWTHRFKIGTIEEHDLFNEMSQIMNLNRKVTLNVFDIYQYAFTEMVNNAIEHSLGSRAEIETFLGEYNCGFSVRDWGIGAFESIRNGMNLNLIQSAVHEVLKGRKTTSPAGHTGEGLFFTRRCAGRFSISANGSKLIFDNTRGDAILEKIRRMKGTFIEFDISRNSRESLRSVFSKYSPEEYDFSFRKTSIRISLYSTAPQSRSLARRIMAGLGEFREIALDFQGVRMLGQAFSDEIFRVYASAHPDMKISVINIADELKPMIKHII
ncbi:MAG: DUF4325 domain-containing protein [Candidatus Aegiribacteria sp.]|nr:DUF4325 domain-containing protein [Candidatus Aegiribacteria sp.]